MNHSPRDPQSLSDGARAYADEAICAPSAAEAPWPAPDMRLVQDHRTAAPAIPDDVLPPFWARWTAEAAEGASAPHAFVATALLSVAGALIGNARWASPWGAWTEPPAINVALIGKPSSGKSPALDRLANLLASLEAEINADFPDRQREAFRIGAEAEEKMILFKEQVKKAVRNDTSAPMPPPGCEPPKVPQLRRIHTTDTTIEKAARLSEANPRGILLIRDELAGWMAGMDRYSGSAGADRAFWLQAYGGRPWAVDRVKDGDSRLHVPHLLWSVVGTIQPDKAAELMLSGDDDGLAARFLYCWPDAVGPSRPTRSADDDGALAALRRLRKLPWLEEPEPRPLSLLPDAANLLHAWRVEVAAMEEDVAGLLLSWLGKLPGVAVRISLVIELLAWAAKPDGTPEPVSISERSVRAAVVFLRGFAIPMARRTFGAAALPQPERDAHRLARWMVRQNPLPETVNARELRRMAHGPAISDAKRMEAALQELEAAGWVRAAPDRAHGYGRQRKDYAVNPHLYEFKA